MRDLPAAGGAVDGGRGSNYYRCGLSAVVKERRYRTIRDGNISASDGGRVLMLKRKTYVTRKDMKLVKHSSVLETAEERRRRGGGEENACQSKAISTAFLAHFPVSSFFH